jgi:DNA-binding LacI/PurR family transcriptional regulator
VAYFSAAAPARLHDLRLRGLRDAYRQFGLEDSVTVFVPKVSLTDEETMSNSGAFLCMRNGFRSAAQCLGPCVSGQRVLDEVDSLAWDFARHKRQAVELASECKEALADRGITAWVGYNDEIALLALDFLQSHRVPVPRHISVVGFDDTLEGFGRGLTSYSFNVEGIVSQTLEHFLAPVSSRRAGRSPSEVITVPGTMVERVTCARRTVR